MATFNQKSQTEAEVDNGVHEQQQADREDVGHGPNVDDELARYQIDKTPKLYIFLNFYLMLIIGSRIYHSNDSAY